MAHLDSSSREVADPETILSGYKPRANNFDEMMDADGRVREHWRPFLRMLAELGPAEVDRRFAAADRHLRDSGVFYRVYEDPSGAVRPWLLSHIPMDKTILNTWLKAGYMDKSVLYPTDDGTPQGGISTLLTKLRTRC